MLSSAPPYFNSNLKFPPIPLMATTKNAPKTEAPPSTPPTQVGNVNGETQSPEDAQKDAVASLEAAHQQDIDRLNAQHELSVALLDPAQKPIDAPAYDATAPRAAEAPLETLKPSQRQGEGITEDAVPIAIYEGIPTAKEINKKNGVSLPKGAKTQAEARKS
jgi:hypothetical protein